MMKIARIANWILLTILCVTCSLSSFGRDQDKAQHNSRLNRFYPQLRALVLRHYPQATGHLLGEKIHFEQNTRVFLLHEPLKTGEWQDPREVRGPQQGGVLCEIELRDGKYMGAAVVPQTFDKRYFKLSILAPYSPKHNAHLYVHLSYPSNVGGDFLKQFTDLVNSYEKYLD